MKHINGYLHWRVSLGAEPGTRELHRTSRDTNGLSVTVGPSLANCLSDFAMKVRGVQTKTWLKPVDILHSRESNWFLDLLRSPSRDARVNLTPHQVEVPHAPSDSLLARSFRDNIPKELVKERFQEIPQTVLG
eukprot:IDg584t1